MNQKVKVPTTRLQKLRMWGGSIVCHLKKSHELKCERRMGVFILPYICSSCGKEFWTVKMVANVPTAPVEKPSFKTFLSIVVRNEDGHA